MVEVKLSGPLKAAAGGRASIPVEAANIHQLLSRLGQDHPKLKPLIDRGVAVSYNSDSDDLARRTFRFSILYLSLLFAALLVDHYFHYPKA